MNYLINCSNSKQHPDRYCESSLDNLSFSKELHENRVNLIKALDIFLDWQKTLPAWQLYTGRLYKQIDRESWTKPHTNVLILSALFGWIKHTDLVPYYDLSMNKHRVNGELVSKAWFNYGTLNKFIDSNNDIDLLTQPYRRAIHNSKTPVASTPYDKFKDNYGTHKGRWLNNRLSSTSV